MPFSLAAVQLARAGSEGLISVRLDHLIMGLLFTQRLSCVSQTTVAFVRSSHIGVPLITGSHCEMSLVEIVVYKYTKR